MAYDHKRIEEKWRKYWEDNHVFYCDTHDFSKPKYYALDMFPYPSGQGLHVGHPEGYTATDIVSRMKRMQGYNVLHPMGWDAFGLPAEDFARKNNQHPEEFTRKNIAHFKDQIQSLGMSIDWSKEFATIDPSYYKWTQWIFARMFENDLAYVGNMPVNYCPELGTVLANEEVIDGKSERGGYPVIRMPMRQWVLRITRYADRLEKDLEGLNWPKSTLELQKNWIGRSQGVEIDFAVKGSDDSFKVFTTRVDTLFGCTYCCLAPEHPLVKKLVSEAQKEAVDAYVKKAASKSDLDRSQLNQKDKEGVFLGAYAINPINDSIIPIYVADYVLGSYGTGAVMAVPAHDERDYAFAMRHKLPMIQVLEGDVRENAFVGDAPHINSGFANGMNIADAKKAIAEKLVSIGKGRIVTNYKLRDWIFSRQRYWGEPIPMVQTEDGKEHVCEDELPLVLPPLDDYQPAKDGKPPLSKAPERWLHTTYKGEPALRETNTMPQWAGSSWYYIRYIDPQNNHAIADKALLDHWLPVDLYIGGQEHAVLHLLYARFYHKFLKDIGMVSCDEPFKRVYHQGMILGENGEKMSKSRGNVVNPDKIVIESGADSLRLFEMFAGPLNESKPWSTTGLTGARRFIERAYRLVDDEGFASKIASSNDGELDRSYHAMIKKVTEDYDSLSFNTAISAMMVFVNDCYKAKELYRPYLEGFTKAFSCICPFVGEEMWEKLGHSGTIAYEKWPTFDESKLITETVKISVSVNGKMRDLIEISPNASEEEIKQKALTEKVKNFIDGKTVKTIIVVKGRIVNFVVI